MNKWISVQFFTAHHRAVVTDWPLSHQTSYIRADVIFCSNTKRTFRWRNLLKIWRICFSAYLKLSKEANYHLQVNLIIYLYFSESMPIIYLQFIDSRKWRWRRSGVWIYGGFVMDVLLFFYSIEVGIGVEVQIYLWLICRK